MLTYLHPGVYIEEIPSGVRPIEGVSTSTAAFVGYTTRGPMNEPTLIFKLDDYEDQFGGIHDTGPEEKGDPMGQLVTAFFLNGGRKAYIVRIASGDLQESVGALLHPTDANKVLGFEAANPGIWADGLTVKLVLVDPDDADLGYKLEIGRGSGDEFEAKETFSGVGVNESDDQFISGKVNDESQLVTVHLRDEDDCFVGTSTSGDLSDFTEFGDLKDKNLKVTLDGAPAGFLNPKGSFGGVRGGSVR